MDTDKFKSILEIGETSSIEFKRCGNEVEHDVFESICAFLNRFGGDVFLGVCDDGTVCGVNSQNAAAMIGPEKPSIGPEKPSIASEKPSIGPEKPSIGEGRSIQDVLSGLKLSRPTHDNILLLYGTLSDVEVFGRSRVMAVTNLTNGPAGDLINTMLKNQLLITVVGQGKGKYRFRKFGEEATTHAH